jgi:predicted DNA-binding WGR domain protein
MTSEHIDIEPLLLYRIDRDRNMARFYVLTIEPTLFGGTSLVRSWGRIGTRGQHKIQIFPDIESSTASFEKIARRKQRRGYRPASSYG